MDTETLVQVQFQGGRYEGLLTATGEVGIEAVYKGKVVAVADITDAPDLPENHRVTVALPPEVIGDGVQVVSLRSVTSGTVLDRITLMAGSALEEDIRADLALLRDELEMLKRAFRRHCAETGQD